MSVRERTAHEDSVGMSKYRIGQWVAFESVTRDRHILGKIVSTDPVAVETRDRCEPGETRRITFYDDAPWFPSAIRWDVRNGRKSWKYAR